MSQAKKAASKKQNKMSSATAKALCITLAAVILVSIAVIIFSSGVMVKGATVASTEHFKVSGGVAAYFLYNTVNYFYDYYGSNVYLFNLDPNESLKKQYFSTGYTWFEYFVDSAASQISELLCSAEGAYEAGLTLSEKEKDLIKERAKQFDLSRCGKITTLNDIVEALELTVLSEKYTRYIENKALYTEEEFDDYLDVNRILFELVSFRSFPIYYKTDSNASAKYTRDEAYAIVQELLAMDTDEEFVSYITDLIRAEDPDISDKNLSAEIAGTLVSNSVNGQSAAFEWAFASERKAGDTYVEENGTEGCYYVCILIEPCHLDESPSVNASHILITAESAGSDEAAKAAAEALLVQLKASADPRALFAEYVLSYSEDDATVYSGGLYANTTKGTFIAPLEEWFFAEERSVGDMGIVKTDYGYHVTYFDGEGLCGWKLKIYNSVYNNLRATETLRIQTEYPVTVKLKTMGLIPA